MKNGPGYSFPYEKKLAVDTEWKRFLEEGIICVVEKETAPAAPAPANTVDIGVGTDSKLTCEVGVQTPPLLLEKNKIKKKKNAETQTLPSVSKLSYKYKFDLPLSFKKHYKEYSDLVSSIT